MSQTNEDQRAEIRDLILRAFNLAECGFEYSHEYMFGDEPPPKDHKQLGTERIKQIWATHGTQTVLSAFRAYYDENDTYEPGWGEEPDVDHAWHEVYILKWCARVGLPGVDGLLIKYLRSDDAEKVVMAAIGLAYLGLAQGFDIIEQMCKGCYRVRLTSSRCETAIKTL